MQVAASLVQPSLWVRGVHGGSGESRIAALCTTWAAADHLWPTLPDAPVLLVARSHADGLLAAHRAIAEWAAGSVPQVRLVGLAVVADAPGRLPRPLLDLQRQVTAGVSRFWEIGWCEPWRFGATNDLAPGAQQLLDALC